MSQEEFIALLESRFIALEASLLKQDCRVAALEYMVYEFLGRQGVQYQDASGKTVSIEQHSSDLIAQVLQQELKKMSDHDPNRATMLSKIIEQAQKDGAA
jgi:hypothetical protein